MKSVQIGLDYSQAFLAVAEKVAAATCLLVVQIKQFRKNSLPCFILQIHLIQNIYSIKSLFKNEKKKKERKKTLMNFLIFKNVLFDYNKTKGIKRIPFTHM